MVPKGVTGNRHIREAVSRLLEIGYLEEDSIQRTAIVKCSDFFLLDLGPYNYTLNKYEMKLKRGSLLRNDS